LQQHNSKLRRNQKNANEINKIHNCGSEHIEKEVYERYVKNKNPKS